MMQVMTTAPVSPPVALGPDAAIHLDDELAIVTLALTPDYWTHTSNTAPELAAGRIISVFEYTHTWSYWERHPVGDELVYLMAGEIDLLLDDRLHSRSLPLRAGEAAIVP